MEGFSQELAAPIAPGQPVGEDPRYSGEFEVVRSEIAKTTERDWDLIVENSREILTRQGKDLTILGYCTLASAMSGGWEKASHAARAYAWLLANHWDALHPLRERARQNAIRWLAEERVVGSFAQVPVRADDHPWLVSMAGSLQAVRAIVDQRFSDSPPSLKPLLQLLEERIRTTRPAVVPPTTAASASKPTPEGGGAGASRNGVAEPASPASGDGAVLPAAPPAAAMGQAMLLPSSDGNAPASRGDLLQILQKAALQFIATEPSSPLGYRLLRTIRWQEITAAPRNDQGATALAPPNRQRMAFLEGLCAQRAWGAILEKSEPAFTEPGLHLWLDLQRYVVLALEGIGAPACAQAVQGELCELVRRAPQIVGLRFNDGTPFAAPATREWLEEIARDKAAPQATSAAVREDTLAEDITRAQEIAAAGNISAAIDLLQSAVFHGDLRSRTERQIAIARLALQHGRIRTALAVSRELEERTAAIRLDEWDPALARAIFELRLKALSTAIDSGVGDSARLAVQREDLLETGGSFHPSLIAALDR